MRAVIAGSRTPIGTLLGGFVEVSATDLGGTGVPALCYGGGQCDALIITFPNDSTS